MEKFMIQRAINRINNGINLANENVDKDRFDENSRQAIGELQICKKALEKQIPKKAERVGATQIKCDCGVVIRLNKYCPYCGQALNWEE